MENLGTRPVKNMHQYWGRELVCQTPYNKMDEKWHVSFRKKLNERFD